MWHQKLRNSSPIFLLYFIIWSYNSYLYKKTKIWTRDSLGFFPKPCRCRDLSEVVTVLRQINDVWIVRYVLWVDWIKPADLLDAFGPWWKRGLSLVPWTTRFGGLGTISSLSSSLPATRKIQNNIYVWYRNSK